MTKIAKTRLAAVLTTSSVIAMAGSAPALARQTAPSNDSAANGAQIEEVVVTARRTSEALQSTPIAVTAVGAQELKARSVTDIGDLSKFTPSLHVTASSSGGNSNAQFYIRGVGQSDYLPTAEPGVGVYVDNVYIARTTGNLFDLADIQQIEVLRGPQGTLFGKNTSGGAVSVTTRRPTGDTAGAAEVTVGNFNHVDVKLNGEAPLIENKLAGSLSFVSRNAKGYGTRLVDGADIGDTNLLSGRVALNYVGGESFSYYLTADYARRRERTRPVHIEAILPSSIRDLWVRLVWAPQHPGDNYDARYISSDPLDSWAGTDTISQIDVGGVSGIGTWALGSDLEVKSITAYRAQDAVTNVDNDGSPLPLADYARGIVQNQFSQEFQVDGKAFDDRLKYVFGAFYMREDAKIAIQQNSFVGFYEAQRALGASRASAQDFELRSNVYQTDDSYAAYGHLNFALTDKIGLTAGLRVSREKKDLREFGYQIKRQASIYKDPANTTALLAPETMIEASNSWNSTTPTLGIQYQATPHAFFYATYAKGFKSGGFDGRPVSGISEPSSFAPEKVASYEVGSKLELFDRSVRLNTAAYFVDYNNLQASSVVLINGQSTNVTRNAGKARIQGVEVEALWKPLAALELGLNTSYTDAKFLQIAPGTPFTLSDHLTNTPRWIADASAQYRHDLTGGGDLVVRVDYAYTSSVFSDLPNSYAYAAGGAAVVSNGPYAYPTRQKGFGLANARLTWNPADGVWSVAAFGTNLTDKRYRTYGFSSNTAGITEAYYGPPRQYGLSVSRKF